jgi:hypothetical protein
MGNGMAGWREILSSLENGSANLAIGAAIALLAVLAIAVLNRRKRPQKSAQRDLSLMARVMSGAEASPDAARKLAALDPVRATAFLRATRPLRLAPTREAPIIPIDGERKSQSIQDVIADLLIRRMEERQRLLADLERSRGTRVLAIVHGREWVFDSRKTHTYFDRETTDEFISAIRKMDPEQPLDLILHTPGGEYSSGLQLARALKAHRGRKTAFVPFHAFSMGTIIALVADQIAMGEHAVLGPIDAQFGWRPAVDLVRLAREKPLAEIDDTSLLLSYLAERAIQENKDLCDVVNQCHKTDGTCALTMRLASGELSHGYPISVAGAHELGINVVTGIPEQVYSYVELCQDIDKEPAVRWVESP